MLYLKNYQLSLKLPYLLKTKEFVLVSLVTSEICLFKNCPKEAALPHALWYVPAVIQISKIYFLLA